MTISLQDFYSSLSGSGLMTAAEAEKLQTELGKNAAFQDVQLLASELIQRKLITRFQARALTNGNSRGLVLGSYAILELIGVGGMGHVYKAQHRRMKRIVAIKVLSSSAMKSTDTVRRFQREVEAAAQLIHPNIVTAYDADEQDGVHYLVMEYVDGDTLSKAIRLKGRLPLEQALAYMIQTAKGLEYAHGKGMVHRDIKPGNLLVDSGGVVKILDMGLARFEEQLSDATGAGELTQEGQIMGTLDYMSPEQAEDTRQADARSDIYSLGCTLFYMLTGHALFQGDTVLRKLLAHREREIPNIKDERPESPDELDRVMHRMVAKNPADRFQRMGEVISALDDLRLLVGSQTDRFDPYVSWLGGSPRQSFDHYQLLALPTFESDPKRILSGYEQRCSLLRQHELGDHAPAATRILGEVEAAFRCLSDPDSKQQYDAKLRETRGDSLVELPGSSSQSWQRRMTATGSSAAATVDASQLGAAQTNDDPDLLLKEDAPPKKQASALEADLDFAPASGDEVALPLAGGESAAESAGVEVQCSCGGRFMAAPHLAGKTVRCPSCSSALKVPGAPADSSTSIEVVCDCTQRFSVAAQLAGKLVKCTQCGKPLLIPSSLEESTVSAVASSIVVKCKCGRRFAATLTLAGKTLKCPGCGDSLTVPSAAPGKKAKPPRNHRKITCVCGKKFSVRKDLAGKEVSCPHCKRPLKIPK